MNKEIVSLGNIFLDKNLKVREFPSDEKAITPTEEKKAIGGSCGNYILTCSRMGMEVNPIAAVSKDTGGKYIIKSLKKEGINTKNILTIKNGNTPKILCLNKENGEKSFLGPLSQNPTVLDLKNIEKIDLKSIKTKILYLSGYSLVNMPFKWEKEAVLEATRRIEYNELIFDPGPMVNQIPEDTLREVLGKTNILTANIREIKEILKNPTEENLEISQKLISRGISEVYIKLGRDGSYFNNGKKEHLLEIEKKTTKNESGSGDAFNAGITYGKINQLSIKKTLQIANELGKKTATKTLENHSLPTKEEIKMIKKNFI